MVINKKVAKKIEKEVFDFVGMFYVTFGFFYVAVFLTSIAIHEMHRFVAPC